MFHFILQQNNSINVLANLGFKKALRSLFTSSDCLLSLVCGDWYHWTIFPLAESERAQIMNACSMLPKLHVVPLSPLKCVTHRQFGCEYNLTSSCISAAMCVVLPPGAAHKSRIFSPGWGSRTWATTADGKFYKGKKKSIINDSKSI